MLTATAKNTADKGKLPDVVQYRTGKADYRRTLFSFIFTFFFIRFPELAERGKEQAVLERLIPSRCHIKTISAEKKESIQNNSLKVFESFAPY